MMLPPSTGAEEPARPRRAMTRRRLARRHRGVIVSVYALLFLMLFGPWRGVGYDDFFYFAYLSSPLFDGDLELTNDLHLSPNSVQTIREQTTVPNHLGRINNTFAIGTPALWLPFHGVVRAAAWVAEALPGPAPPWAMDRFSQPFLWAVSLGTLFYGLLAVLLMHRVCLMRFSPRASLHAALGVAFASPLLGYALRWPAMSHACSAFAAALLVYLSFRLRRFRSVWAYVALGLALGLVAIVRWQDVILGLVPAGFFLAHLARVRGWRARAATLTGVVAGGGAFALLFSLQSAYWRAYLGRWLTTPQQGQYMMWDRPEVGNFLFSGWNGALYWHPLLLLAGVGLVAGVFAWRRLAVAHWCLVAAVVVAVYVNACVSDWYGGSSFGARRVCGILPLLAPGLAALYARLPGRLARLLPVWTLLVVGVNVVVLAGYQRGVFRPFFATEFWLIGGDALRMLPRFVRSFAYQDGTVAQLLREGHAARAAAMVVAGMAVMALVPAVVRLGAPAGPVWRWRGVLMGALVAGVLAVDAWFLRNAVAPDPVGLEFARVSPRLHPHAPPPPVEELERFGREWTHNPGPWLLVLERATDDARREAAIGELRRHGGTLWAKAVRTLPDTPLRRGLEAEAARTLGDQPGDPWIWHMDRIHAARAMGRPWRERRALVAFLRAYPFHVEPTRRLSVVCREEGRNAEADRHEALADRVLEARMEVFRLKAEGLGPLRRLLYIGFVDDQARALDSRLWQTGRLERAKEQYRLLEEHGVIEPREWIRWRMAKAATSAAGPDALVAEAALDDVPVEAVADAVAACLALGHPGAALRVAEEGRRRFGDDPRIPRTPDPAASDDAATTVPR